MTQQYVYENIRFWSKAFFTALLILVCFQNLCPAQETNQDHFKNFSGQKIFDIVIHITDSKTDHHLWESMARDIIPIKKQDLYSLDKIEKAIAALVDSNMFQSVHVADPDLTPEGVILSFSLTPFGRIKDIVIHNAFPLFQKEVINVMSIFTGDSFSEKKLNEQPERIKNLFKDQGYTDPQIKVSAHKNEADGNYVIFVEIEKGDFYSVNTVKIVGNHHFSSLRLNLRINTWKASVLVGSAKRFVKKALEEDIKNFISFYREKGFADVQVAAEVIKDDKQKTVAVMFNIKEGPLYEVSFHGNKKFRDYTLKKEMVFSKEGNKNNFGLKKSIRNLKKIYTENGYLDVVLEKRIIDNDPKDPSIRKVVLEIDEGRPYRVSGLKISGNHAISEKEILKSILTRTRGFGSEGSYVPQVLEADINAVRAIYRQKGYTGARVEKKIQIKEFSSSDKSPKRVVEIYLAIDEGIQTLVGKVEVNGLTAIPHAMALSVFELKPGGIFNESMIETDEKKLQEKISEAGYPHVAVKAVTEFTQDRSRGNLFYQISEGPRVTVGQIFYMGNFRTREDVLENEMEIAEGQPLLLSKLLESRRNILDINAIDSARFRTLGLKTAEDEMDIVVEVAEKKPYFFEAGTGYDTERHFYFNTLIGDHNFAGRNLDLQSGAEISQIGYKADISLTDPRLFSTRTASSTRLFTEDREEFNKDFGTLTYGASQDFSQSFFEKKLTAGLGFVYEFREQYLTRTRQLTGVETEHYSPRHIIVASPGLVYKTTDSYVRPRNGIFSSADLDISKGIGNDQDDFIKYRLDARFYYTLFEPLTVAVRGRYGFIQPYGSNTHVPEDQLFFLGGTSTVRGFDENLLRIDASGQAVGGREVILGSLEARCDLGLNLELTTFYDIGTVAGTQGRSDSESFRDSVGIGLRYLTPIGPIGFLYGHKLDPKPNESAGSFHFSMGYTF
ncbi:MAG: outer membrane protein assembly factor BamA [Proteobacteria bacterium]|nr:outer membrane protein assembly factor BamA [Pseudomonadota bacterium]MBU1583318.1 outer membrane protein assembly factor BamA [Pseudomonadota bacterium]MBU2452152.1 outer membrane protein assembly factor BamA [Pseudomonadota bacterium]MBU2629577.1 outer membrane protein assembly factor BamA [Pseudomonadota bacterium]